MASWRAPGSILEAPGLDFHAPGEILESLGPIFGFFFEDLWAPPLWECTPAFFG